MNILSSKPHPTVVLVSDSPWYGISRTKAHEVASIYVHPNDRFVVSMILGYSKRDEVHSPKEAAQAALEYVRDTTDDGNVWHVFDRETGELHVFEQCEFTAIGAICSICKKPCNAKLVHLHQNALIGDECCWDERLRMTE